MNMEKEITSDDLRLTPRETEIMELLSTGLQDKEIAYHLRISIYTVKNHLKNIYPKLKVQNRVEALLRYKGAVSSPLSPIHFTAMWALS